MALTSPWIWAVGFEDTFIGQTARGERPLDAYELTQHYDNWKEDLELARRSGASMIRYGVPWYKIETADGVFDWSWTDEVMAYFAEHREFRPIVDLMHYGTPLWMEREFMNPRYPQCVARYAEAFARRYGHIAVHYTPLNEPFINAEWCGWSGTWPPYLSGLDGFVAMMVRLCEGIVLTVEKLREAVPGAVIVHVEAAKLYVESGPELAEETKLWNEIRFVMWELVQGLIGEAHPLRAWLLRHGATEAELAWFQGCAIAPDIVGLNYYPQFSVNVVDREVVELEKIPQPVPGDASHMAAIIREAYRRYGRPVFITETSYRGTEEERIAWLEEVVRTAASLAEQGVELAGITWFPFMDMVDWPYRTNGLPRSDNMATFGLYTLSEQPDGTLRREKNAVGKRFEEIVGGNGARERRKG